MLDGALGTMIQKNSFREEDFRGREFMKHPQPLAGFNDILNLTKPNAIKKIHSQYLEAGANIITTNTFNANRISMEDYGLQKVPGIVKRINAEGVKLASAAIQEYKKVHSDKDIVHLIGGSVGPTNRSASMSPDITDPLKRNITYNELFEAYREQCEGLIESGVDLLIFETFFDTLNLKAGLAAAETTMKSLGKYVPIMVSATVSDNTGRILSGQTINAFISSINNFDNVEVVGINCGFGPDKIKDFVYEISRRGSHFVSCHPNAGLPDETGCYNVSPEEFGESIREILDKGVINIIGGCCGTTPDYIKILSETVRNYRPFHPNKETDALRLSGLEALTVKNNFITVGERCNVAGSAKFLRLIKEENFIEAAEIAKNQIEKGADVIDINMDDPLLEADREMVRFLRYILAEPDVSKVPFMIDSSRWDVIEGALKNIQGKGIVNSLSLKEGEETFIKRASKVKELGFALMVMAFDEKGQADTFERKKEVCERSYKILNEKCGYKPEDIIFDVNVMTIATGMPEHSRYAIDFIKAVEWIKKTLPGVRTSGGVSNLSFAFRGKNLIRKYMHVVFLHYARLAGLDMAIINPAQCIPYDDVPKEIREVIEDIIFDRDPMAVEKLIEFANQESKEKTPLTPIAKEKEPEKISIEEKLTIDLIKGDVKNIETHVEEALQKINDPVKIIEGPLLEGMKTVGDLFGEGKMFLPQVVKTARAMKKAVEFLTPYIEKSKLESEEKKRGKILIATVKGDVHDIGKNIVSTVLSCNNYEIIDLGIMVSPEKIVETALTEKPDIICLSGLITPSLSEMAETVKQLSEAGLKTPVMVGGAATSLVHTALKIAPNYDGPVFHMGDASQNPLAAGRLLNPDTREAYINETASRFEEIREKKVSKNVLLPFEKVIEKVEKENRNEFFTSVPSLPLGENVIINLHLNDLKPLINWKMFFLAWKLQGKFLDGFPYGKISSEEMRTWEENLMEEEREKGREAFGLYQSAIALLDEISNKELFDGKAVITFQKAKGDAKEIIIGETSFPMLRQQKEDTDFLSCADYVGNKEENYIGLFSVTAGRKLHSLSKKYEEEGDTFKSLLISTLADRIVEAASEWLHGKVKSEFWPAIIRPAWGYPMLPDQTLILKTQDILNYDSIGVSLTENGAMFPPASISGIYFAKPEAKYFMVGEIGEDQINDYASRLGLPISEVKNHLRQI